MAKQKIIFILEDDVEFYRNYFPKSEWKKETPDISKCQHHSDIETIIDNYFPPDHRFRAVILDLELYRNLPDEVLSTLQYLLTKTDSKIPILVISDHYTEKRRNRILDMGGVNLIGKSELPKPESGELEKLINNCISSYNPSNSAISDLKKCEEIIITDNQYQINSNRDGNQIYYCNQDGYNLLIGRLVQSPVITPCYYTIEKDFSIVGHENLPIKNGDCIKFTFLKARLRVLTKMAYDDYKRNRMTFDAKDILEPSKIQPLSEKEVNTVFLEEMFSKLVRENGSTTVFSDEEKGRIKSIHDDSEFADLFTKNDFEKLYSVVFIHHPQSTTPVPTRFWQEPHLQKSAFKAGLVVISLMCILGIAFIHIAFGWKLVLSIIASFCLSMLYFFSNDPRYKFYRTGGWLLGSVILLNAVSFLSFDFEGKFNDPNAPFWAKIKFIVQENMPLSITILFVGVIMMVLQYLTEKK